MKFAVIGHPIKHTLSPMIHHENFRLSDLDYFYQAIDIQPNQLKFIRDVIEKYELDGFNVTIPHKESIIEYLDDVGDVVKSIGAVNTVAVKDGHLHGYNTDVTGYLKAFNEKFNAAEQKMNVLIIGAGGAAKAVLSAHLSLGHKVTIATRNTESYDRFINQDFTKTTFEQLRTSQYDVVVNATPVGMQCEDLFKTLSIEKPSEEAIGLDLIYAPLETPFLEYFHEDRRMNGIPMLIHQAMDAFEIWTGQNGYRDDVKLYMTNKFKEVE